MLNHLLTRIEGAFKCAPLLYPANGKWTVADVPDLTGKVALVTGGSSGIGYETVKGLLEKNATVYIGARSVEKANEAIQKLKEATGNQNVHLIQMDLADLSSLQKSVTDFKTTSPKLHILINNAGVMVPPLNMFTTQGYDLQWGTNVLGHYLLTKLLLPTMEATAATMSPTDPVRIIDISSSTHFININTGANIISYETLHGDSKVRTRLGDLGLYSQSKSGNILVAQARARLLKGHNIVSMSVHPGHLESSLHRYNGGPRMMLISAILYPGPMGAITPLYAATAPETAQANGKFFIPWAREGSPRSDHINNIAVEDKLIAWLEEHVKEYVS